MDAWGIPAINTLLLLSSGVTVTIAHWALKKGDRANLIFGLALTVLLGIIFLALQAYEYTHAYSELNLKLTTGVFGSTFFMLTGFHGFHVTLGAMMLIGDLVPQRRRATSSPTTTSASRPWPGTGTSSTWCGCCSSSSSTGCRRRLRRSTGRAASAPPFSLLEAALDQAEETPPKSSAKTMA